MGRLPTMKVPGPSPNKVDDLGLQQSPLRCVWFAVWRFSSNGTNKYSDFAASSMSNGLQPNSDVLQPNSDGLQPVLEVDPNAKEREDTPQHRFNRFGTCIIFGL